MANKTRKSPGPRTGDAVMGCCRVESLISLDGRGQMVLPKELREKADIRPGDKLAVISGEQGGKVCCIMLIKADEFADTIRDMLGPLMGEILRR